MLGGIILPRGKVMFGMMKAELSKLAANNGVRWSIQGGVMTLVPVTGYLPGQAVQINSATGMIGTPVLLGGRRNRHPLLHQLKHKNWPTGADQPGRDQSVGSDQPEPISHGGRRTLLPGRYYAGWLLSCPGHRLRGRYPRERLVQRTHLPSGRPLGSGRPASSGSQLRQRKSLPFSPLTVSATCLDGDVSSRFRLRSWQTAERKQLRRRLFQLAFRDQLRERQCGLYLRWRRVLARSNPRGLPRCLHHEEIQQQPIELAQPAHRRGGSTVDPQPGPRGSPLSRVEYVARQQPGPAPAAADCIPRAAAGDEPAARIATESRPFADPGGRILRRALSRSVLYYLLIHP